MLRRKRTRGFTLMEVVIVMGIIAVLGAMVGIACRGYVNRARERVCEVNCIECERVYESNLILENKQHEEITFTQYMLEDGEQVCPLGGVITYVDDKVVCSIQEKGETSEIPIL
nr:type II secretion system protein [uncultured Niameybacter sp.]